MSMKRKVVWFSCGAASACAAKLTLVKYPEEDVRVVYCDVSRDEHPDNERFRNEVAEWIGHDVETVASDRYRTIDEVFAKTRYMAGIQGARCTVEMKKVPRFAYQRPDDIHIFGFTKGEEKRAAGLQKRNPELSLEWPLIEAGMDKRSCFRMLADAGIVVPEMYRLGYANNNCRGCVKATSPGYWNKVRQDFPEQFDERARRSRELGVRLVRVRNDRIFLDELKPSDATPYAGEYISCGPDCTQLSMETLDVDH